ncbi:MAG TPA: hypothetical protein VGR28_01245 [Candidatus Thermoplasmatota archaeon]|jgi:hypothetical protein|nr:hypothetical protein [Candidatus Thermoplasmatota archaeon]
MRAVLPVAAVMLALASLAAPAMAGDALLPVLLEQRAAEGVPPSFAPPTSQAQSLPVEVPASAAAAMLVALLGAAVVTFATLMLMGRERPARR